MISIRIGITLSTRSIGLRCLPTHKIARRLLSVDHYLSPTESISHIQDKFEIFTNVRRVLDLGTAPGYWAEYARDQIIEEQGIKEEDFVKNCHVVGVDLLFSTPPNGTSKLQGNIFSEDLRKRVESHCKEIAFRQHQDKIPIIPNDEDEIVSKDIENSYFFKEMKEVNAQTESGKLEEDYKVDLILSDLGPPLKQKSGFWVSTATNPYKRLGSYDSLRKPLFDKGIFDLADAALVYACDLLKHNGKFVLRLSQVDTNDAELKLLHTRLLKVFNEVNRWGGDQDIYFICKGKDDAIDKVRAFKL
ncbi:hypothetical protein CAAN1_13S02278 [[Candida] anglica]|uniref:rRNA methyltransferase 2, mitochondrial n=1 Tax=[Candida] anglica TaxID=148631 RepID=A0ABP0EGL4_9ASCO